MHLIPRALNGVLDLSMLLGTVPWEKEIVGSNDVGGVGSRHGTWLGNLEDREAVSVIVLNRVVRVSLNGEVGLSTFTYRGSQPSRHPEQECFRQQK